MGEFRNGDTQRVNLAIIGGGLGGLAFAVGLAQAQVPFHIFEASSQFSEIGAGITFGPNAVRAIGHIDPRLLQGYKKHATFNVTPQYRNTFNMLRWGQDSRSNGKKAGDILAPIDDDRREDDWTGTGTRSCIHRARFLEELIALIPPNSTTFSKSLIHLEEDPETQELLLHFSDGTQVFANAVVGADGIKSRVRSFVSHGVPISPSFAEEYVYRALVPRAAAVSALGEELATNGQIYCGYGGYIITYPIEHHALLNIVAVRRLPKGSKWLHSEWQTPSNRETLLGDWKDWIPGVIGLLSEHSTCDQWALHHVMHDCKYNRGRVVLLGDSAHASTPHCGAGGGMAMEDAYILSGLLAKFRDSKDVERVFEAYDGVRRLRTQRLVKTSDDAGRILQFLLDGVRDDEKKVQDTYYDALRWIWHEDLEAQLRTAQRDAGPSKVGVDW